MGRGPVTAIVVLLVPFHALAAGPYVSLTGGAVFLEDSDLDLNISGLPNVKAEFDTGFAVLGAAGYAFDPLTFGTLRAEAEIAYRENDVDKLKVSGVGSISAGDATVSALSGMVNAALDVATGTIVEPYVFVGIGGANVSLDGDDFDDEDDTVFAYQAGAGLGFAVTDAITLFAGYRFFGTTDPEFEGVDAEYHSHNIEGGIRFEF
jgi:opacity protein-like surface antigen